MTRGLIFCPEMVLALLAGRKTQTRRLWRAGGPTHQPGELRLVREPLKRAGPDQGALEALTLYAADCAPVVCGGGPAAWAWQRDRLPAMFMPNWAARLGLLVRAVRTGNLHTLSEDDARAEGVQPHPGESHLAAYRRLWDRLHPDAAWASNPAVRVITFEIGASRA